MNQHGTDAELSGKAGRPETLRQAQTWDGVRARYVRQGVCERCAAQLAWGHQIGFSKVTTSPCQACAPVVAVFPRGSTGGWRYVPDPRKSMSWETVGLVFVPAER